MSGRDKDAATPFPGSPEAARPGGNAYVDTLAVGDPLPDAPLFLEPGCYYPGKKENQPRITQITRIVNSDAGRQEDRAGSASRLFFSYPCDPCNPWFSSCVSFLPG